MLEIFDPDFKSTAAGHTLSALGYDGSDGKVYVYGQANAACVVGSVCLIEKGAQITPLTTGNAATHDGAGLCSAQQAFADNEFGWFLVKGDGDLQDDRCRGSGCMVYTRQEKPASSTTPTPPETSTASS